jgi:hypothetical protein
MEIKLKHIIPILAIITLIYSCKTGVLVRFNNDTGADMRSLTVKYGFPKDSLYQFHNIKDKQTTEFIRVPYSYPYCWTKAVFEKDTIIEKPTDYIGEPKFCSGRLTIKYQLYKGEKEHLITQAKRWLFYNDIVILYWWRYFVYKVF